MLLMGNKQRTSEPTAANKTSSRSHAVLQVETTICLLMFVLIIGTYELGGCTGHSVGNHGNTN